MDANEQKARELLAAEYAKAYAEPFGAPIDSHAIAVRVIAKALAQQVPADGEGYRLAWEHLAANSYDHHTPYMVCIPTDEWKAAEAMLAATQQAPQPVVDEDILAQQRARIADPRPRTEAEGDAFVDGYMTREAEERAAASQPQQGAVEAADAEKAFFARDFYEEAKAGKVPWPCGTYSPTIGQQAVDDACNCPGGSKPASLHAPNCPVRTTENK